MNIWVGISRVVKGLGCAQPGLDLNASGGGKYDPKLTWMI